MTATDSQVRSLMRERQKGRTQEQAAVRANLKSRQTVAKYEQSGQLPSEAATSRTYRTRSDPFAADWSQVEAKLRLALELEATALFEWLGEQQPGRYQDGQLRTFQRRVAAWRALHQPQVAVLAQTHRPGEVIQVDDTWLSELCVTLAGVPFPHLLMHYVLPYSNWEWGRVAQSESLGALRLGLQSTLFKLGYVPRFHQSDHSSAATFQVRDDAPAGAADAVAGRAYTEGYPQLLAHFGLQARCTHVRAPDENGDVESAHRVLKQALDQHLLLRGSRDFADLAAYEAFLFSVMERRNQTRQLRLVEELSHMRALHAAPLPLWHKVRARVNRASLIRVQNNSYSVPTTLIGRQVVVRVHEWHLEVYYGTQLVEQLPRLVGRNQHRVNYRHVIDTLLRKPGGFRDYRYRDDLFPSLLFRQAWEQLQQFYAPRKADLTYLRVLHLAARTLESEVACALELLLASGALGRDAGRGAARLARACAASVGVWQRVA